MRHGSTFDISRRSICNCTQRWPHPQTRLRQQQRQIIRIIIIERWIGIITVWYSRWLRNKRDIYPKTWIEKENLLCCDWSESLFLSRRMSRVSFGVASFYERRFSLQLWSIADRFDFHAFLLEIKSKPMVGNARLKLFSDLCSNSIRWAKFQVCKKPTNFRHVRRKNGTERNRSFPSGLFGRLSIGVSKNHFSINRDRATVEQINLSWIELLLKSLSRWCLPGSIAVKRYELVNNELTKQKHPIWMIENDRCLNQGKDVPFVRCLIDRFASIDEHRSLESARQTMN